MVFKPYEKSYGKKLTIRDFVGDFTKDTKTGNDNYMDSHCRDTDARALGSYYKDVIE